MAANDAVIRIVQSLKEVDPAQWNACAQPPGEPTNPFLSHEFLSALEESGSATKQTGWMPYHLVLEDGCGGIAGCMPMYLKSHSRGEYVFDYGWADAFERAGGRYYPKLQVSVPFTPATARKLLVRPDARGETETRKAQLFAGMAEIARRTEISSVHLTFVPEDEWSWLGEHGLLLRTDSQFHWENRGYETFQDFLEDLASRKRKNLRKEREKAVENDIEIEWVTGSDLTEAHWDAFYEFYMDTGARKWGTPYLTRSFFSLISERLAERTLLIMAKREGRYIAGALNFIGDDTLFGRNWGTIEHHPFLHFECCYYQAIDFAISRGLKRVEAGAQGAHKLARGYLPAKTYSAHYIAHAGFREAVESYLNEERRYVDHDMEVMEEHSPFRHETE